jgi:hypothetical protein
MQVVDEGDWRLLSALVPGPGQLLLQTQASVVSSGTELKALNLLALLVQKYKF